MGKKAVTGGWFLKDFRKIEGRLFVDKARLRREDFCASRTQGEGKRLGYWLERERKPSEREGSHLKPPGSLRRL